MCWLKTTEQVSGLWTLRAPRRNPGSKINDWVSEETKGKIGDLLPPGTVDSFTRLVLTTAIYFNASWTWPFDEETHPGASLPPGGRRRGPDADDV